MKRKSRMDIEQEITDKVIASLEAGVAPWRKSWRSIDGGLALRENGEAYQGFNQFILSLAGRSNPYWLTFNKAAELSGCEKNSKGKWIWDDNKGVREGETGEYVCYWGTAKPKKNADPDEKPYVFQKWYKVFNAEQIDNLPEKFFPSAEAVTPIERDKAVEEYIYETGADIRYGGGRAFYIPSKDYIQLPVIDAFDDFVAYAGIALHELAHWSGAEHRLNRNLKTGHGSKDYAREELVAECAACLLASHLGLEVEPREDHASYLSHWLEVLKEDKTAIRKAFGAAQKVVGYLDGLQPQALAEAA